MFFKTCVVLLLTVAVFTVSAVHDSETIRIEPLPENAEDIASEFLENFMAERYPDNDIAIGESMRLYLPDNELNALDFPMAIDYKGVVSFSEENNVFLEKEQAKQELVAYNNSLINELREKDSSGPDEMFSSLYESYKVHARIYDKFCNVIVVFSDGKPHIAGTHNPLVMFHWDIDDICAETDSTFLGYGVVSGHVCNIIVVTCDNIGNILWNSKNRYEIETLKKYDGTIYPPPISLDSWRFFSSLAYSYNDKGSVDDLYNSYQEINQIGPEDCFFAVVCMRLLYQIENNFSWSSSFQSNVVNTRGDYDTLQDWYEICVLTSYFDQFIDFDYYLRGITAPEAGIFEEDILSSASPEPPVDDYGILFEDVEFDSDPGDRCFDLFVNGLSDPSSQIQTLAYNTTKAHTLSVTGYYESFGSKSITFYDPSLGVDGVQFLKDWDTYDDNLVFITRCRVGTATGDDRMVISESSENAQFLRWIPYLNFDVKGYTVLSRDEAGQITQLSGVIRNDDTGGWQHFETESEGELGVRYYPIGNSEPVDVFTGEEFCFE